MKTKRLLAWAWLATFAAAMVVGVIAFEPVRQATILLAVLIAVAISAIAFVIGTIWSLGQLMGER